jgi:hypothetical protein
MARGAIRVAPTRIPGSAARLAAALDPVAESLPGIGQQRLGRVNAEHRSSGTDQLNREVHYPAADIQDLPRCSAGSKQSETQRRNGEMGGVRAVLLRNPSRPAGF